MEIVSLAGERTQSDTILDIQREMVVEERTLAQTSAGRTLEIKLDDERERHQKHLKELQAVFEKSLQEKDKQFTAAIQEAMSEIREQMQKMEVDRMNMQATWEQRLAESKKANEEARAADLREREERLAAERAASEADQRRRDALLAQERKARGADIKKRDELIDRERKTQEAEVRELHKKAAQESEKNQKELSRITSNAFWKYIIGAIVSICVFIAVWIYASGWWSQRWCRLCIGRQKRDSGMCLLAP
jgi:hypothetical protein